MEALAALGGAALGGIGSIFNNERNIAFQKEAQDWNKWAQQVTWEREDNAVQRRMADMMKAGLHPTLAAGNAAQAGSPTKIDPISSSDALGLSGMLSGAASGAQTQQSLMAAEAAQAQIDLTNAQKAKVGVETAIDAKELMLYGTDAAGARRHPKYEDKTIRMIELALGELKKVFQSETGKKIKGVAKESGKILTEASKRGPIFLR